MKYRLSGLFIFILIVGSLAMPVQAQSGIDVSDDRATLSFPNTATFSANISANAQITLVILEYGVEQLTCGEVIGKAFPDFTPGTDISVQWIWDMRQSGSEPPGAVIWWQWRVTLQGGGEIVSERQTVTWLDDIHEWQVITGGNINLHWYRGEQDFGDELHTAAVDALERLALEVGIRPDQPISLYIYANSQDMQDAILYEPSWTGGVAYAENSIVIIGISQSNMEWGKRTEAHELTHVLVGHLTFTCLGFLPNWLSEGLAEGGDAVASLQRLDRVYRLLQAYDVADRVILDLSEVRGMEYYTGITFRGVAPGSGWPVTSGGRYDDLISHFGRPMAAVGFGLGIERALLIQSRQGRAVPSLVPSLMMHCCDHPSCLALLRDLRKQGCYVEVDVLDLDRTRLIDRARLRGIGRVLHCEEGQWHLWDEKGERVVTPTDLLQEAGTWQSTPDGG